MIVAITGATGFIGHALMMRHVQANDTVRILSRRPRKSLQLPRNIEFYEADLSLRSQNLSFFADGANVLYHCAGEIRDETHMNAVHVLGTAHLLEAAANKIGRWVQLSSVGAYGFHKEGIVTEETPLNPQNYYEITKTESDRLVVQAAQEGKIRFSMLRPSCVFGPRMPNNSLRQWIQMIKKGLFFFIGPPGAIANYIDVNNVVEALILCGRMPQAEGRIFNLSDHRTIEDFVQFISQTIGQKMPKLRIPEKIVRLTVLVASIIPGIPLTLSRIDALVNRCLYSNHRIERELGYSHAVSMEKGLKPLIEEVCGV